MRTLVLVSALSLASCLAFSCSAIGPDEGPPPGTAAVTGSITGLTLASEHGVSIARSFPPTTELKIAVEGLTCGDTQASDRLTIDVGSAKPGTYTVVKGYPGKTSIAEFQARAHACPKKLEGASSVCHELVTSGKVVLTRVDADIGGRVEGTFEIVLSDGQVQGSFSATRCQ